MIELLLSAAIVGLAALGLGLGVLFGRGPVRTSCEAAMRRPGGPCATCPMRRRRNIDGGGT